MNKEISIRTLDQPLTEGFTGEESLAAHSYGKFRTGWFWILTLTVVILSFGIGIIIGLGRGSVNIAQATLAAQSVGPQEILSVPSMELNSVGKGAYIGGSKSELFSFSSTGGVKNLLTQQVDIWKSKGFFTSGMATDRRGVAFAINKATKDKYQTVAFFCPEAIRGKVCSGQSIFGMTSYISGEVDEAAAKLPIPVCPNGKVGGLFAAADLGKPTLTATVICPQSLDDVEHFFRVELEGSGWNKSGEKPNLLGDVNSLTLLYEKGGEELSFILSSSSSEKTMVVLTHKRG